MPNETGAELLRRYNTLLDVLKDFPSDYKWVYVVSSFFGAIHMTLTFSFTEVNNFFEFSGTFFRILVPVWILTHLAGVFLWRNITYHKVAVFILTFFYALRSATIWWIALTNGESLETNGSFIVGASAWWVMGMAYFTIHYSGVILLARYQKVGEIVENIVKGVIDGTPNMPVNGIEELTEIVNKKDNK